MANELVASFLLDTPTTGDVLRQLPPSPSPGRQVLALETRTFSTGLAQRLRPVGVADLYPSTVGRSALIHSAMSLLGRSVERLDRAHLHAGSGEVLSADYEVTLVQGDVPELFACKGLSDGFGTVVVAAYQALRNRKSQPLSLEQIAVLRKGFVRLSKEMFLQYDAALDLLDEFEAAGLTIDPPEAGDLEQVLLDGDDR
jgi:hypothetical protein